MARLAYRLVHIDNLELLARRGGIHAPAHIPDDGEIYRPIHDAEIQAKRARREVPCGPGGTVDDYVGFYLGPRSPMLFRLWKSTVPGFDGGQSDLIYLVTSIEELQHRQLPFVFTDGHSISHLSQWYDDPASLANLSWETIEAKFWFDTDEDNDRSRRKQAELLVHRFLPWEGIVGIATLNAGTASEVRRRLEGCGVETRYLKPMPHWYYE